MYIRIVHTESEIQNIGSFITRRDAGQLVENLTAQQLLQYAGDTDITNKDRVFRQYTPEESRENQQRFDQGNFDQILLKIGTQLLLPNENLDRETLFKADRNVVVATSEKAFIANQLEMLLRDPLYTQTSRLINNRGVLKNINTDVSVFMWIRSLSNINDGELAGGWVNISAFVNTLNTIVTQDGGQFQIQLSPLICKPDPENGWIIDPDKIRRYNTGSLRDDYLSFGHIHRNDLNSVRRSEYFFHTAVQENDLVFIRFEKLARDREDELREQGTSLNPNLIPGNTYDMIGLVDGNPLNISGENTNAAIQISGRDLSKVLIEDGSYFFPLVFAQQIFSTAGEREANEGRIARRSKFDGRLVTLNAYLERSISFSLQFIINQLSNTGLVPNTVFQAYERNVLSRRYRLTREGQQRLGDGSINQTADDFVEELQDGVWQIIKLVIDPSVAQRRIVDSSIAQEQGPILNSIKKLCQEPFVEFRTDTYGDQFYFIVRKPPFDKLGLTGLVYDNIITENNAVQVNPFVEEKFLAEGVEVEVPVQFDQRLSDLVLDIEEEDVISEDLNWDREVYSWYQLTPQGLFWGNGEQMSLAFIPAIPFDEYAEVWGSKPYQIVSNYVPFRAWDDVNSQEQQNFFERQAFSDLQYMIQSTQYLPFTRRGSITITGSRLFKRGLFIRYRPTNEIFYVEDVNHIRNINAGINDRTTILTVRRGMVEPYIRGVDIDFDGEVKKVSYFNIINTELDGNISLNELDFLKNWRVDRDIFNFFLTRSQWKRE